MRQPDEGMARPPERWFGIWSEPRTLSAAASDAVMNYAAPAGRGPAWLGQVGWKPVN
jgi:hypothetical protein